MTINEIIPSRFYSFVYESDADTTAKSMNKGGRAGVAPNPLYGRVSSRKVYAGQAATSDMYTRKALTLNPNWQPSEREPRFEATSHPCVVTSLSTGDFQVRIMNPRRTKTEYFVDGRPATQEELAIIRQYKRQRAENPLAVKIMFPYLGNLTNVDGEPKFEPEQD